MYSYIIEFFTLNDSIRFKMMSSNEFEVNDFVNDLLSIFITIDKDKKPLLNTLQKYSNENKKNISAFTDKYKIRLPQLNSLSAFFRKLKPNEWFIFLPNMEIEHIEWLKLKEYLKVISECKPYTKPSKELLDLYEDLLINYNVHIAGNQRINVGEKNKNKRICRFCSNKNTPISFNNKAHAISEALGNKTIILFDECDKCNKMFSETIEPDIIQYLSLYRTFFDVKGKGGNKKIKGKNFVLKNDGKVNINFTKLKDKPDPNNKSYNLKLDFQQPSTAQNIYKSLCKYFLSVIDEKYLKHFKKSIDWIKGNIDIKNLPKIAELTTYDFFSLQPKITCYIRKNEDKKLPFAIGEFHFTCVVFVFIIPLSDSDNKEFIKKSDYKFYWKSFKHFDKYKSWVFNDYSNNNPRDFIINLDFNIDKKKIFKNGP